MAKAKFERTKPHCNIGVEFKISFKGYLEKHQISLALLLFHAIL